MKSLFISIIILGNFYWGNLHGFPPRDEKTFVNNCIRLLNSQQYSFLTQYFEEYYPQFHDLIEDDYIEEIVVRIPFTDKKKIILKTYINHATKVSPFAYDLYGQIKFFEKDYQAVIRAYKHYDRPERYYYLGWAEKKLGNLIDAREWFLKAVEEIQSSEIKESTYLELAEIYILWKNFSEARKALRKVSHKNYLKSIIYYYLYQAEGNDKFLKRIIAKIKKFPQDDPIIKDFLEKEELD